MIMYRRRGDADRSRKGGSVFDMRGCCSWRALPGVYIGLSWSTVGGGGGGTSCHHDPVDGLAGVEEYREGMWVAVWAMRTTAKFR